MSTMHSALAAAALVAITGCGGGGSASNADAGNGQPAARESWAPACADLVDGVAPTTVFDTPLIDPAAVGSVIVLGDMEPDSPQEILNFEQGFYIPDNAPLQAPATLYVESITRSMHQGSGITDWGFAYHVCSYADGEVTKAAVSGNFAHLTTLGAELKTLFDTELAKQMNGEESAVSCGGPDCDLNINRLRDLLGDPDYSLVVDAGTPVGTGGPINGEGPAGIDANLQDRRLNDFSGNYFINPNRIGAEEGHGSGWRYGVCTYDYFAEPHRSQYLEKVLAFGELRESTELPCGTIEVDVDAEGSAAGLWGRISIAEQSMGTDLNGAELDEYLGNMLVLNDHFTRPDTKLMLSTSIDELSLENGSNSAFWFDKSSDGSIEWNNAVNVPFKMTEAGTTYCYAGKRIGGNQDGYYLVEISDDGATLSVERVQADCSLVDVTDRAMNPGSPAHFQFAR